MVDVSGPSVGSREPTTTAVSVPRMPRTAGAATAKRASSSEQVIGRRTTATARRSVTPIMMTRNTPFPGMTSRTALAMIAKAVPTTTTTVLAAARRKPIAADMPTRIVTTTTPTVSGVLVLGALTASQPNIPVMTIMASKARPRPTAERRRMSRTMPPTA